MPEASKRKQEGTNSLQAACCLPTERALHPRQSPGRQGCNGKTATSIVRPLESHGAGGKGIQILVPEVVSETHTPTAPTAWKGFPEEGQECLT